ncbi:hypothetical protein [Allokutzneria albata]|uniref:Uncharacterized protein n=1 Tax=Allokutzneria albata TaxID=211114 RepID=A0A1G9WN82_ALLAB|nr:hypothetical protein [Allokutzneria albata]SDM85994.1 hypothetical protein SAMN04489726_3712 [Allokutzneria albata]
MDDPRLALAEVERQRTAMAARIRLPWWFLALFAVTWTAVVAGPALVEVGLPRLPYTFFGVGVLIALLVVFRRRSGLHLLWQSREYPSMRRKRQVVGLVAVLMGVPAVSWTCLFLGAPALAVAVAVVGGVLAADQCRRTNAGIRADVLAGR